MAEGMEKQSKQEGGDGGEKADFESCSHIVMLLRTGGSNSDERQQHDNVREKQFIFSFVFSCERSAGMKSEQKGGMRYVDNQRKKPAEPG